MGYKLKRLIKLFSLVTFCILLQFLEFVPLAAQTPTYYLNPSKDITQYNIESWTREDGLPTNSLLSLCQTSDGYLWISSYDGLIRFDGDEFVTYNNRNVPVFESNTIRKLAEGRNGELWMTTQGNGLVSHKNGRFIRYGKDKGINHLYRAIYVDEENRVWSASPDKGWFYLSKGEFTFLEHSGSLLNTEVRSIEKSADGSMWFGTFGEGLYQYKDGQFQDFTEADGLLNNWVYSLYFDSNSILWIGTSNGLCYYDGTEFNSVPSLSQLTINGIFEDKHQCLWVATNNGLFRKKKESNNYEKLSDSSGLPHNFINDFLIDIEGNIWLAFYKGGLGQLKDGKFTNYTQKGGVGGKVANAIIEFEPGIVLTAFDNGKFSIIDGKEISDYRFKTSLLGKRIRHILKDSKGNLWFSTYSGLLKVSPNGREVWIRNIEGLSAVKMRLTFEDSQGNIWVGTRNNGAIKLGKGGKHTFYNAANGLSANLIMSIDEDSKGNILIGTSEGESGFNIIDSNGNIKQFSKENGFVSNVVFNSYSDQEGNIWVAALGGLVLIQEGNKVTNFTSKHGLSCDSPFDVVEDNLGGMWLPCSKGIMRISKNELLSYNEEQNSLLTCRLFDQHDGMTEPECNPTTQSVKTADGMLWFPTINGIAKIDPSNIPRNNFKPPVYIRSLIVDGRKVELKSENDFKSSIKRFTFNYTAISLYEPERISFKYKLEGFDKEWIEASNERTISYTNLKHGKYSFKVLASNSDGLMNDDGAQYDFYIQPKFHNTFLFYALVITLIALLIYVLYKYRVRSLQNKQQELEKEIVKRTEEITEQNHQLESQKAEIQAQTEFLEEQKRELNLLNASKDKMFSIIGHDLRSPLGNFRTILDMMVNSPHDFEEDEREELLKMLLQNAQATYELLENLLNWSSSQRGVITYEPRIINAKEVSDATLKFVAPMAIKKNINIISGIDENIKVFGDENMLRAVFRNLIGNAIKFTREGGTIALTATRQKSEVVFGVEDNGVGMTEEIKAKLFSNLEHTIRMGTNEEKGSGLGLLLCKEFIEKHGGRIWVESEIGQGSTFYFSIPPN